MKVNSLQFIILLVLNEVYSDEEFTVKVNKRYTTSTNNNITLENFPDLSKISELEFVDPGDRQVPSNLSISNFPALNIIDIENQYLETAPIFSNISETWKVSLGGNNIKTIENTTFSNVPSIDSIYLHSNQISYIDDCTFPSADTIILNCNKLTTFKSTWFRVPEKLRTIYLRNNQISTLDKDAFKGLSIMFHLMLASNQIKQLPEGIFTIGNFHTLDLDNNQLYEIKANWFAKPKMHITRLRVDFNRLSYIEDEFFEKVRVFYAFFSGNPWQCPCLDLIKKWMLNSTVYGWVLDEYKDVLPVCIYANSFKNHCIKHIDEELYETYSGGVYTPYRRTKCHELF